MINFKDDSGDFALELAYQFNISCEQTENFTAKENVRRIGYIISRYFQEPRYKNLDRIGGFPIVPNIEDPNIRTGYMRYNCALVPSQNTIYRRY